MIGDAHVASVHPLCPIVADVKMSGVKWMTRAALFSLALLLINTLSFAAANANAKTVTSLSATSFGTANETLTQDGEQEALCPFCGRVVCRVPNDLVGSAAPCGVLLPPDAAHASGRRFVRLPQPRAPDIGVPALHASFRPRGPPLLD
ncbi:MAG: hypothetical protein JSR24_00440 [Proteobacteria bacterium]|nr:hypothetical protein [Pseudomonadota bacterium]